MKKLEIGKKNIRKMKKMRMNEIKEIIKGESVALKKENDDKDKVIVVSFSLAMIFFISTLYLVIDKFFDLTQFIVRLWEWVF